MIPFNLAAWAMRHHVSVEALDELRLGVLSALPPDAPPTAASGSEEHAKSLVRLEAAQKGVRLFRNNVGALEDKDGRLIRFGLANDSKAANDVLKSHDLIGWRRVLITPAHVGRTIAQFLSREIKRPGWTYTGQGREEAQLTWGNLVNSEGGDAAFTTGPGSL